ncbi:uncharacterized protein LOC125048318 [Penaeus chinensis]|uniref:uncharacterized protein LOC125048318 n=1 Tax=Penaeus chinensis TaxID=139456 RepID=UPI001FB605EF|nr:uncharacterized protein LOC125048318 [Penaeus chinensis]XP_047502935.1 uncharacterized protein LOC125048318 [Penaeus chinensis]XP_047502937.1 uncharacterized protein LOC125048318 [Penaeus chinensis]
MNTHLLISLVALLAHGACCQRTLESNIDALLSIVSEEQIADILTGERLDLENCFRVTKDVKSCTAATRTFIALAQQLSDTGYKCDACEPTQQAVIDNFLSTVRGTPNCQYLVSVLPIPDFC